LFLFGLVITELSNYQERINIIERGHKKLFPQTNKMFVELF